MIGSPLPFALPMLATVPATAVAAATVGAAIADVRLVEPVLVLASGP